MDEWRIHFGAFTDLTYDLINDNNDLDPVPSSIPESVLNLPRLIINNSELTNARNQTKNQNYKNIVSCQPPEIKSPYNVKNDSTIDDIENSSNSSSSSADFEIEILQKHKNEKKVPKVKMNRVVYGFAKPEPEIRRMFVTSRAPRSRKNEKATVRTERIHLSARLTSRRKIPVSSMVHQHELMLVDISDLEKK